MGAGVLYLLINAVLGRIMQFCLRGDRTAKSTVVQVVLCGVPSVLPSCQGACPLHDVAFRRGMEAPFT